MFLEFYDIPYHLASGVGFLRCGGLSLTNFWVGSNPAGSPYIYFPFWHILESVLLSAGVPLGFISYWASWSFFPLSLLAVLIFMAGVYGSRAGFYAVLLLSLSPVWMEKQWGLPPQALVFIFSPLVLLALDKKRYVAASVLILACMFTHVSGIALFFFLPLYALHRKGERKALLTVAALLLIAGLPALWFGLQRLKSGVSGMAFSGIPVRQAFNELWQRSLSIKGQFHSYLGYLALPGLVLCYIKRGKFLLISSYALVFLAFILTPHALRFWSGGAIFIFSLLGAVTLSVIHERIEASMPGGKLVGLIFFITVLFLAHYLFSFKSQLPDFVKTPNIIYLRSPQLWQKSKPVFSLNDRDALARVIREHSQEDEFFWINSSSNINNYISAFSSHSAVYTKFGQMPQGMKVIVSGQAPGADYTFLEKINNLFNAYLLKDASKAAHFRMPQPLLKIWALRAILLIMLLLIISDIIWKCYPKCLSKVFVRSYALKS